MTPTVGRTVHYVAYGTPGGEYKAGAHRAAIVTEVHSPTCLNLLVANPTGIHFVFSILQDEPCVDPADARELRAGTWHWPEREAA